MMALPKSVRRRDALLGVAVGVFVLSGVSLLGLQINTAPSSGASVSSAPRVGAAAPDLLLPTSTNEMVGLAALRGQPVWLTFWASWCPPCRVEMPDLQDLYQSSAQGRYRYLAVNLGEDPQTVQRYLQEIGYSLPVALDANGEASLSYRVSGLPTHVFIGADGAIRDIYVGVLTSADMRERANLLW